MADHAIPDSPAEALHTASGTTIFSTTEVEQFRADDREAATAIVCLMAGIFTIGLIGYLGVCYWVSS